MPRRTRPTDPPRTAPQSIDGSLARDTLKGLFESSFDGMLLVASGGRILEANRPASRLLGRSPGDLIGKRVRELGATGGAEPEWAVLQGAATRQIILTVHRPDRSSRSIVVPDRTQPQMKNGLLRTSALAAFFAFTGGHPFPMARPGRRGRGRRRQFLAMVVQLRLIIAILRGRFVNYVITALKKNMNMS